MAIIPKDGLVWFSLIIAQGYWRGSHFWLMKHLPPSRNTQTQNPLYLILTVT